jgi:hypothetical protein
MAALTAGQRDPAALVALAVPRIIKNKRADSIIGEIGLDVTGVFGTAQRLCSWAKVSPRTVQSGATKRSGKTGKGNFYLKSSLGQAATGAAKTDTFLGERYWRLVKVARWTKRTLRRRPALPGSGPMVPAGADSGGSSRPGRSPCRCAAAESGCAQLGSRELGLALAQPQALPENHPRPVGVLRRGLIRSSGLPADLEERRPEREAAHKHEADADGADTYQRPDLRRRCAC